MAVRKNSEIKASDNTPSEYDGGVGLELQEEKPRLKQPPLYSVIMLNDDYTPMEFVVHVLQHFFGMSTEQATNIMLTVHTKGSAICGVFTKDVAETKSEMVNQYSQENEHPLVCKVEQHDDGEEQ